MSDDPFPASAPGAGPPALAPGKHRGPRFSWNSAYETTFFTSLCESVHLGLREGNTFKPEAWDRALQALITHHNAYANKGHLINKSDNARKKFRLWRGLREDPDFHYDVMTRTVNASEEAWARHLQVRRHVMSRRRRVAPSHLNSATPANLMLAVVSDGTTLSLPSWKTFRT